jgi:hypothetical protein
VVHHPVLRLVPSKSNFNPEPSILLYPSDVGTNMHQASYILFARHSVSGAKVESKRKKPTVKKIFRTVYDDEWQVIKKKTRLQPEKHSKSLMPNLNQNRIGVVLVRVVQALQLH